jgi:uncharacterized protein
LILFIFFLTFTNKLIKYFGIQVINRTIDDSKRANFDKIDDFKKMKKRFYKLLLVCLFLFGIAAYFVVEHVLPYSSISPWRHSFEATPADVGLTYEAFSVHNDTVTTRGYYVPCDNAKATIICVHGISNCKETFLTYAKQLHDLGCNVVLVDLRAHGKSGGKYCTFGYYEKYDLQKVIDYALSKSPLKNIGIQGHSLGGSVALQTLALDNRLRFGIVESTYSTFPGVMLEYAGRLIHFKNAALTNYIIQKSSKIANFEISDINPIEACAKITVPMFMEHGTADERIPFEMGKQNFAALASTNKTFYGIENGDHNNVHTDGGKQYWAAVKAFIVKQF